MNINPQNCLGNDFSNISLFPERLSSSTPILLDKDVSVRPKSIPNKEYQQSPLPELIERFDQKSSLDLSPKSTKQKKIRFPFQIEFAVVKNKSPKVDDNNSKVVDSNSGRESKTITKSGRAVYEPKRFEP